MKPLVTATRTTVFAGLLCMGSPIFACVFKDIVAGMQVARVKDANIYSIFASHVHTSTYETLMKGLRISYPNMSLLALKKTLETESKFIMAQRRKSNYLQQLIDKKKIDWLGVESPVESMEQHFESNVKNYILSKQNLENAYYPHLSEQEIEDLLSMAYNEHTRIVGKYRIKNKKFPIQIVPLENNKIHAQTGKVMEKSSTVFSDLNQMAHSFPSQISESSSEAIRKLFDLVFSKTSASSFNMDKVRLYLSQIKEPEIRQKAQEYIDLSKKATMLHYRREVAIATKVSKLRGNGLIIMGTDHKTGLLSEITNVCKSTLRTTEDESVNGIE